MSELAKQRVVRTGPSIPLEVVTEPAPPAPTKPRVVRMGSNS